MTGCSISPPMTGSRGGVRLEGVSNTDGIASTQHALPGHPLGVFAAINNDTTTAVIGWDAVFDAIGGDLAPEAVSITPSATGPIGGGSVDFAVVFSEPVTGFDDAADLIIAHAGMANTGVSIAGSGANYTVTVSGIGGVGSFTLAVSTASDVQDLTGNAHAASVASSRVLVGAGYHAWAEASGLVPGVNDGVTDDPDGDGCKNIREFATGDDPLNGAASGRERLGFEPIGGGDYFTCTFPARSGAIFSGAAALTATLDGIIYKLFGSPDLIGYDEGFVEVDPPLQSGLPALDGGWSYRTFRLSRSVAEMRAGFVRLSTGAAPP